MPTCPDCHAYGTMAELNTHVCVKPTIIPYETEGINQIRSILTSKGVSDEQISTFKACLFMLENKGYRLIST